MHVVQRDPADYMREALVLKWNPMGRAAHETNRFAVALRQTAAKRQRLQVHGGLGAYRLPRSDGQQPGPGVTDKTIGPTKNGIHDRILTSQEIGNSAAMDNHNPPTTAAASAGRVLIQNAPAAGAGKLMG